MVLSGGGDVAVLAGRDYVAVAMAEGRMAWSLVEVASQVHSVEGSLSLRN